MDINLIFLEIKRFINRIIKKIKLFLRKYVHRLIRHTKAGDYSILTYFVLVAAGIIIICSMMLHRPSKKKNGMASAMDASTEAVGNTTTENTASVSDTPNKSDVHLQSGSDASAKNPLSQEDLVAKVNEIYGKDKAFLILVNKDNPLDEDYTFEQHQLNCGEIINQLIYDDLAAMLQACNDAGYEYNIVSGYRSREDQQKILDNEITNYKSLGYSDDESRKLVLKRMQKPGCSEHETGLSLDITREGNWVLSNELTKDKIYKWLVNHCHEYGFVLRYPTDKSAITGIDSEPWHFRYVGKEAAMLMYNNDLTLEEFHELITGK